MKDKCEGYLFDFPATELCPGNRQTCKTEWETRCKTGSEEECNNEDNCMEEVCDEIAVNTCRICKTYERCPVLFKDNFLFFPFIQSFIPPRNPTKKMESENQGIEYESRQTTENCTSVTTVWDFSLIEPTIEDRIQKINSSSINVDYLSKVPQCYPLIMPLLSTMSTLYLGAFSFGNTSSSSNKSSEDLKVFGRL